MTGTNKIDVSIIVLTHRDGRLSHHTLRSIARSRALAHKHRIATELIVIANSTDTKTYDYLTSHSGFFDAEILTTDYKDKIGFARNDAVRHASGTYISIMDGDDMISENWITACYQYITKSSLPVTKTALRAMYSIVFGGSNHFWIKQSSNDPQFHKDVIFEHNPWDILVFAHRDLFLEIPYYNVPYSEHFGLEDYLWNCETLAAGIEHIVVPETTFFYRVKNHGSLLKQHIASKLALSKTAFFDPKYQRELFPPYYYRSPESFDIHTYDLDPIGPLHNHPALIHVPTPFSWHKTSNHYYSKLLRFHKRLKRFALYRSTIHLLFTPAASLIERSLNHPEYHKKYQSHLEVNSPAFDAYKKIELHHPRLPDTILNEWKSIGAIEPMTFPDSATLQSIVEYRLPKHSLLGSAYAEMCRNLSDSYTDIFVAPWIVTGGADQVLLKLMSSILEEHPERTILLITTRNHKLEWRDKIPKGVHVLEFGKYFAQFNNDQQKSTLYRILLQFNAGRLFVVNSYEILETLSDYARLIAYHTKIYLFTFTAIQNAEGRLVGYPFTHFSPIYEHVEKIITDNQLFADHLIELYAYHPDKVASLLQPVTILNKPLVAERSHATGKRHHFIWAARIDPEKRPDVLIRIAEACRKQNIPAHFHVYGKSVLATPEWSHHIIRALKSVPNITFHGAFKDGIFTIPHENACALVYTSEHDGIPTVLLEAGSLGLPIIAPRVGGVPEVINAETGILIEDFTDVDAYVAAIKDLITHPKKRLALAKQLRLFIQKHHSFTAFKKHLSDILGS